MKHQRDTAHHISKRTGSRLPDKKPACRVGFRARSLDLALALSLTTGLLFVPAIPTRAQTTTWTGNGANALWSNTSNWSPATFPNSSSASAVFTGSTSVLNTTARLDSNVEISSLTFNQGNRSAAFVVTNQAADGQVKNYSLRIGAGGIANNTIRIQTISTGITLQASQSFTTMFGGTLLLAAGTFNQVNLNGATLTIAGPGTTNIQSPIVDTVGGVGNLVKNDSGTLTLTGANTYTGNTTINGGLLNVGDSTHASSIGNGTGQVFINSSGILAYGNSSDAGTTTINNSGTLRLWDTTTASNARIINNSGAVVDISPHTGGVSIGRLTGEGDIYLGGNALTLGNSNISTTISGTIQDGGFRGGGGGSLIKTGTGMLTLSGINTYTGGTTINTGMLAITSGNALGTGTVTNNGTLLLLPVMQFSNTSDIILSNLITGTGGVDVSGGIFAFSAVNTLSAANTFTGGLRIYEGGTLALTADQAAGVGTVTVTGGHGTSATSSSSGSGVAGGITTLTASAEALSAVTALTLQGGNGGAGASNKTGGKGGAAVFNLTTQNAIPGLSTLTLTGGTGGGVTTGMGGAGGGVSLALSPASLPDLTLLTLTGGNGGKTTSGGIAGAGGDVALSLSGSATAVSSKANVVFKPGAANDSTGGSVTLNLNGHSLSLGGLETANGAVTDRAIIQNNGSANATLSVGADNANHTFSGTIRDGSSTGILSLVKTGTGTLTLLGGNNDYSGSTTVAGGTLLVDNAASLGRQGINGLSLSNGTTGGLFGFTSGNNTINRAFTLQGNQSGFTTANASDTLTLTGTFNGIGNLTTSGPGTIILTASNTYVGSTTIAGGTLIVKNLAALGTGAVTNNANLTFDTSGTGTFSRNISGSGTLTRTGTGTLTLTGSNTYSGGTILQGGTLALGSNSAVGSGRIVLDGGTLQASGSARTVNNAVTLMSKSGLSSGTVTTADTKVPGLTLAGTVTLGEDSSLNITGNTRVAITGTVVEDSIVQPLIKDGAGTLVLTNDNTYTGGTLVRGGTLIVNNAYSRTAQGSGTGLGAVTVARGATLTGTYVISSAVQINPGGTLSVGNSIGTSQVGSLALSGGSLLDFEIGDDGISSDRIEIAGLLSRTSPGPITFQLSGEDVGGGIIKNLSEGTFTLMTFGFQTGFTQNDFFATGLPSNWNSAFTLVQGGAQPGSLTVTLTQIGGNGGAAAPEPGTLALLLAAGGGAGFLFAFRTRRRPT